MRKYTNRTLAFSLIMIWLISSCSNKYFKNPGETQQTLLPDASMATIGVYPLPSVYYQLALSPTHVPGYPYPSTPTPITPYPMCEEDYHTNSATSTPTPTGWYVKDPTLTFDEVGNAGTEDIVKLLLEKYFEQFLTPEAVNFQIKDYAIDSVMINNVIQCRGPNQLENIFGRLAYSIEPAVDLGRS